MVSTKRKTAGDYAVLAQKRNFIWLGPYPINTKIHTQWQCLQDHRWSACYMDIRAGKGCPHCAGLIRKTPDDYQIIAQKYGLVWLGPEAKNTASKTQWQCPQSHVWHTTYDTIRNGHGCPYCSKNNHPITSDDYQLLADKRGFKWLGPEVPTTRDKTRWRCANGHEWLGRYNDIQQGKGCAQCYGNTPNTEADYHQLASEHLLKWVGETLPKNTKTITQWECVNEHVFSMAYNNVRSGQNCTHCQDRYNGQRTSKPQRKLHKLIGGEMNYRVSRYSIDIAFPNEKICIEYDCWYWHQQKKDHDAKRDTYLKERNWRILRIKAGEKLPTFNQLNDALNLLRSGETYAEIILDDWKG